ncbi:Bug family tripartite tricarboxylate transporter substrate binding protein [Ramlibacter tataouinensis]|uniref:Candidate extracytoplasmic binding receptor n=1 Tax=Ramlibacter tataouinensis (strain ATCC BAA-407 / DSM 14655 / LMG 21543 / TTB310) TaxID=365046 RepID=F5Y386_RAMTT|nr:tripartite tricarboxylate transporter substrate-binding protein [Ramlibacter tataouinensis]AEG91173.1 Candidate extracytoplasmic binding receptor [Ramlibacter tataouinensis TTB310]
MTPATPSSPFHSNRRRITAGLALAAAGLCAPAAFAQAAWPAGKPITLVVGYPAGGSVDLVARIVAEPLSKRLGTPVVVENAGGAGGTIGAQKVVNAAPDGYTLLLGSGSEVSIARLFNSAVRYDGQTDLAPIGMIGVTPMVFVAGPSAGVKTIDEALAKSRREPNKLSFASSGVGTPLHMSGELINVLAGTTFRHVPYRGAAQMVQDLLGGQLEFSVFVLSSALPHIEAGKMTPLGVTTASRSRSLPQVPALGEHPRLKGYDMNVWFGLFGPAKLPQPMVARLNKELNAILREQDVWQKLQKAGVSNEGGTSKQLADFIRAETARVRSVVNQAVSTGKTS